MSRPRPPALVQALVQALALALVLALALAAAACTGGDPSPGTEPTRSSPTSSRTSSPSSSPPSSPSSSGPTAAPRPDDRACYRLDFDAAVAPTSDVAAVDCAKDHTSMTYAVGTLDPVVDGHLLAVDSNRVQAQVARACPARLSGFLGGDPAELRLSMLRAVWFTPTVEDSDAGADWYRCDVIAVATEGRLAPLTGRLAGVLARPGAGARYGMCGTAEPGAADFSRVICSGRHSWRAIRTVPFARGRYPGEDAARSAGQETCKDAGRERASDALNFKWGYEWPTEKQWDAGRTYGLCWAPD